MSGVHICGQHLNMIYLSHNRKVATVPTERWLSVQSTSSLILHSCRSFVCFLESNTKWRNWPSLDTINNRLPYVTGNVEVWIGHCLVSLLLCSISSQKIGPYRLYVNKTGKKDSRLLLTWQTSFSQIWKTKLCIRSHKITNKLDIYI